MQVSVPYGKGKITHVLVEHREKLSSIIKAVTNDQATALFLLNIGAVYANFKRTTDDIDVFPQTILRVHQNPLRFSINYDWKKHIIFENDDFVIVDKPSGLPTHATLDNSVENLHFQVQSYLKTQLYVTHRLDILTAGLIVIAKTPSFQKTFNSMLQQKQILKIYQAKTRGLPSPGLYTHYMKPSAYSPKEMSDTENHGWLKCELIIRPDGNIELLTGRTHQIRAQLAHLGFPLIGDPVYSKEDGKFELTCIGLEFDCPLTDKKYSFKLS